MCYVKKMELDTLKCIFSCEATLQITDVRPSVRMSVRTSPKSDLSEFFFFNQVNAHANT